MTEINMQTMKINEPVEITRKDIENYVKMKFYTELTLIKEKLTLFEKKYNCDFPQFEKSINEAKEEDFERWDDYIEWKAFYKKYNRLNGRRKNGRNTTF
ncbi:MAG: hypothetical protein JSV88_07655 [Candidatus Aminicenantes bacterium]|nr:MAG: hypothetical protein JSV88_07655 [Candidatus Aminicenantes bacterium]